MVESVYFSYANFMVKNYFNSCISRSYTNLKNLVSQTVWPIKMPFMCFTKKKKYFFFRERIAGWIVERESEVIF